LTFNLGYANLPESPFRGGLIMLSPQKWYLLVFAILIGVLGTYPLYLPEAEKAMADVLLSLDFDEEQILDLQIIQETTLLPSTSASFEEPSENPRKLKVMVTAYSSSVWETQGDPYITASGTYVRDGIVANNLLSFGTEIKLPEIFGDKVFVVEDRMHPRKGYYHVDIWFPSYEAALAFGSKLTEIEILTN